MSYFFESKDDAVIYLLKHLKNITPIKIQKGLYFLWAYYSATYGNIDYQTDSEFNEEERYPQYLFEPAFEAWKYGPVDKTIYHEYKEGKFEGFSCKEPNISIQNESNIRQIKSFLDDLIKNIDSVDDFGLVARSHQDKAWSEAFNGQRDVPIDASKIKSDYVDYVEKSSQI